MADIVVMMIDWSVGGGRLMNRDERMLADLEL